MTEAHEAHLHLVVCIDRVNNAWRTLKTIGENLKSPLLGPAFRYALVEYATAFTRSDGLVKKRRFLPISVVPMQHIELHTRVVGARHSLHAHADLIVLDAELHVSHVNGEKYVTRIQNNITGLEELSQIEAVLKMVEAVLDSLYKLHEASERSVAA